VNVIVHGSMIMPRTPSLFQGGTTLLLPPAWRGTPQERAMSNPNNGH